MLKIIKRFMLFTLISFTAVSCLGPFHLTSNLLTWNKTVGGKFVNELVFFSLWIIPAYEVSIILDAIVINTIDF